MGRKRVKERDGVVRDFSGKKKNSRKIRSKLYVWYKNALRSIRLSFS
jgi:hypothetical protein